MFVIITYDQTFPVMGSTLYDKTIKIEYDNDELYEKIVSDPMFYMNKYCSSTEYITITSIIKSNSQMSVDESSSVGGCILM